MTVEYSPRGADSPPIALFESPKRRTVASYERELIRQGARKLDCERLSPEKRLCFVKRTS